MAKAVLFFRANISTEKSNVQVGVFGSSSEYSRTISICYMNCTLTRLTQRQILMVSKLQDL